MSVIVGLLVCLLLPTSIAFAEDKDKGLSYDQAISMAISSNDNLRKIQNEIDKAKNQRNSLSSNFPPEASTTAPYLSTMVQGTRDMEALAKNKALEYDSVLDAIKLELQSIFFNVGLHEEKMKIADQKIQSLREDLSIQQIKYQYGMVSEFDLKKLQNELEKTVRDKAVSEKEVQKQYFALNKLLGQATVKYTHIHPFLLEYQEVDPKDSEHKIGIALGSSAMINYKKAAIASMELKKELYPLNSEAAMMAGAPTPEKPERISDDISVESDDLAVQKRNLEVQIRNVYNNLKSMEANIKSQETQKKILEERIRIAEVQYKAGMITQKQVDDAQLQLTTLNNGIFELKGNHTLLKLQFEKPYLL